MAKGECALQVLKQNFHPSIFSFSGLERNIENLKESEAFKLLA
jgi:hypothetical protein